MQQFASQHTTSFAEFLRQAGVSLAVSTYQAGQLVLIRPQAEGANTHFIAMTKPMGIAVEGGARLTIGDAHRIDFYRNLPAVGAKIESSDADAAYVHRATHVSGDIDIHEMGYDSDSQLWLINTRMSCLCTLDPDFSIVPRWKPPFISEYDLLDRCHLNGLGFRDGKPRYVSMLGSGNEPGSWRRNKISGGRIMDLNDDSVVVDGLCMPHSPRWYRNRLWFLSSGEGCLKRVEADGSISSIVELPGFTRGLAFFDRYALIGLSRVRETAVFAGLPLTQRVSDRQCGVYLVDIEAGEVVGFLHFVGDVHEIFDVRWLPHRSPVLVEPSSPLLASSYELPRDALKLVAASDPVLDQLAVATRLHASGEFDQAIEAYRGILAKRPTLQQACYQLGLALVDAERWCEARGVLKKAVSGHADHAEAFNSLGLCCSRLGEYDEALLWFDRALKADRQFALAHFNRGVLLLKLGQHAEGWLAYERRWQLPSFTPFQCPQPRWQGECIGNKRLLVHSEQSDGDHIQFWRFIKLARERCTELIYVGPEKLSELAAAIEGVDESRVPGNMPRDRFDLFVPLMSLPACLGLSSEDLGMPSPYVHAPEHLRVRTLEGNHKVGFVWQSSETHRGDSRHSLQLDQFAPLFNCSGVDAFSFQVPVAADELDFLRANRVANLEPELVGYSRYAAFTAQFDLIITVDTAMAHLAGAMGKSVWILLASDADWRWRLEGDTTEWYPSARLFRQSPGEAWSVVVDRVAFALKDWVANRDR